MNNLTRTIVCNRALARIRAARISDFDTEQSPLANHCRMFYESTVLGVAEGQPWTFITGKIRLSEIAQEEGEEVPGWPHILKVPDNASLWRVEPAGYSFPDQYTGPDLFYEKMYHPEHGDIIGCESSEVVARVRYDRDADLFISRAPSKVVDAIVNLLASYLANAIVQGAAAAAIISECRDAYRTLLADALLHDANHEAYPRQETEFISSRKE